MDNRFEQVIQNVQDLTLSSQELNERLKAQLDRIEAMQDVLDAKLSEIDQALRNAVNRQDQELATLRERFQQEVDSLKGTLTESVNVAVSRISAMETEYEQKVGKLAAEVKSKVRRVEDLSTELTAMQESQEKLNEEINSTKRKTSKLVQTVSDTQNEFMAKVEDLREDLGVITPIKTTLEDVKVKVTKLQELGRDVKEQAGQIRKLEECSHTHLFIGKKV